MAAFERVRVETARPYDVLVGGGLLASLPEHVRQKRVAILSDTNVAAHHARPLLEQLEAAGLRAELFTVPAGEGSKSVATWAGVLERLAAAAYGRDCAVIGLGGGVVTDLAGFVAASYLRGVAFYSVPTSLLGMVDAGVGGKTGLNLEAGKNLVGAFWQPDLVLADVSVLGTLPERQFRLGAVEFFKHALIGRPEQLGLLRSTAFGPHAPQEDLAAWLAANIAVKARIVAEDEREAGRRAWLNYGHTVGHALEAASSHRLEHGEAVAWGVAFAALLGRARGLADVTGQAAALLRYVAPGPLPTASFAELEPWLARDKKNLAGTSRFVLLEQPGRPVVVAGVGRGELESAWRGLLELAEDIAETTPVEAST